MTDQTYQGWSNQATWNVALWLDNEERYYRNIEAFKEHSKGQVNLLAYHISRYAKRIWPQYKTPDGYKLKDANFLEIAKHVLES